MAETGASVRQTFAAPAWGIDHKRRRYCTLGTHRDGRPIYPTRRHSLFDLPTIVVLVGCLS
jgi:hypothetical protein